MQALELINNTKLLLTIKHRKVQKIKIPQHQSARSELPERTKSIIHAEITETEDEESKAIEIFITINETPI